MRIWLLITVVVMGTVQAGNSEDGAANKVTVCDIVHNEHQYEGTEVTVSGSAKYGGHYFELSLGDSACNGKSILLLVPDRFADSADYIVMMKKIYPEYPANWLTVSEDARVPIRVTGRFSLDNYRNLMTRTLRVDSFELVK